MAKPKYKPLTDEYYRKYIPKNPASLMRWRMWVARNCLDREFREDLFCACARDPLFYFNTFVWILETRDKAPWKTTTQWGESAREIPFFTREYQNQAIMQSAEHLGKQDIVVLKSRETGVTWMYVALIEWDWRFHPQTHIGVSSKDEPSMDGADNPDSLFSKIEFIIKRLPLWLRGIEGIDWSRNRSHHVIRNLLMDSTISGHAATANIARGGRKKWWFMDELHFFNPGDDEAAQESIRGVTYCRVAVSTVNRSRGESGVFWKMAVGSDSNRLLIDIDWKDDKEKAAGLYTADDGKLKILDEKYWKKLKQKDGTYKSPYSEEPYQFILDGKIRSPYYDWEWRRADATPQGIAAELDKNFQEATSGVISPDVIKEAMLRVKTPEAVGDVKYDEGNYTAIWVPRQNGNTELWFTPDEKNKPPQSRYTMGIDIARGTGGSHSAYSAIVVLDQKTGRQMLEFRSNRIKPWDFARLCVAVGRWFYGAYMIPEANAGGGGKEFLDEVERIGYGNLYCRPQGESPHGRRTDKRGYQNQDGGETLLSNLEKAIVTKRIHILSRRILSECSRYHYRNNKIVHSGEQSSEDPGARGKGHGDSAIACALAWHGIEDMPPIPEVEENPSDSIPVGSFAWRQKMFRKQARQPSYWTEY